MTQIKGYIVIDDIRQPVFYFILPSESNDVLNINCPHLVHEIFHNWMENKIKKDLWIDTIGRRYIFKDALVDNYVMNRNRYGNLARDLYITFLMMSFGVKNA